MKLIHRLFQHPSRAKWALNYAWPAWWFTGIKVSHISDDYRSINVKMKLRFYNANYVGTQFGGNLFAMTDPFYMLMLLHNLGPDYIVWDKAGSIEFVSPGRGTVNTTFSLSQDTINAIKDETKTKQSITQSFIINVTDDRQKLVARVKKNVYVRRKSVTSKPN